MSGWVRVCALAEAPGRGELKQFDVAGRSLCVANLDGELVAIDNICPHRQGPLAEGWIEGNAIVCPWHSWAFDARTGLADYPEGQRVDAFGLSVESDTLLVTLEPRAEAGAAGGNALESKAADGKAADGGTVESGTVESGTVETKSAGS